MSTLLLKPLTIMEETSSHLRLSVLSLAPLPPQLTRVHGIAAELRQHIQEMAAFLQLLASMRAYGMPLHR